MRLFLYSVLRLVLLAFFVGLGYVLGLRGLLLAVVAVVLAAAASYLVLSGPRNAAVDELAAGVARRRTGRTGDADAEAEDAADDAARQARSDAAEPDDALQGERDAQDQTVGQLEQPGVPQDADELPPGRGAEHGPGEPPGGDR